MRNFIICLKHGNKYGPEYVNTLESMVRRNCTMSFEFVCFTDDPKGINSTVRIMPLSNAYGMRVPNTREWLGVSSYTTPTNGTFSVYSSVTYSLLDRILLDKYNKTKINTGFYDYLEEVIVEKNYLPAAEHSVYWTLIQNAPAFNFFFKAVISVICTIFGFYYIINRVV